jgi:RNA 2',3'-cyclic 3'-phosphodiesterase
MTRVFIGIKASPNFEEKVQKWQETYQELKVRFIKPKNLHLTLVPPWYEEDTELPVALLRQIEFEKFVLTFDKIVVNFKNKVIWVEVSNPPSQIFDLLEKLYGIFPHSSSQVFKVHITIARFKDGRDLENMDFKKINWKEKVKQVTLFESILGRRQANYKVLFQV